MIKYTYVQELKKPFRIGDNIFIYLAGNKKLNLFNLTDGKLYNVFGKNLQQVINHLKTIYDGTVIYLEEVEYIHHTDQLTITITEPVYGVKSSYILQQGTSEAIELYTKEYPH